MALAGDTSDILSIWGATLTIVRLTTTYGDTGKPTRTWASADSETGYIQPLAGGISRTEVGRKALSTHEAFLPNGTDILAGDRIRTSSWAAGDDEYEVTLVQTYSPSHVRAEARIVKGHGG